MKCSALRKRKVSYCDTYILPVKFGIFLQQNLKHALNLLWNNAFRRILNKRLERPEWKKQNEIADGTR